MVICCVVCDEDLLNDTRAEIVCQMSNFCAVHASHRVIEIIRVSWLFQLRVQLRLAAPGDATVAIGRSIHSLTSGTKRGLATRQSTAEFRGSWDLLILHLNQGAGGTVAALLLWLLVSSGVESEEEEEVAGQDDHASKSSKLLTGANTGVWHPWEVAVGEVGVGCKVDEAEVDDELDDLHDSDVLLPPDADATCGLEVVPVHDDVNGQVEGDWNPGDSGIAEELDVGEERGRTVVVGVEEG